MFFCLIRELKETDSTDARWYYHLSSELFINMISDKFILRQYTKGNMLIHVDINTIMSALKLYIIQCFWYCRYYDRTQYKEIRGMVMLQ